VTGTDRRAPDESARLSALPRVRAAIEDARRARYLRDADDGDGQAFELWVSADHAVVRGEWDRSVAETLEGSLATLDHRPTVIDLSGVTFPSAAAVRALVNARRRNPGLRFVEPSAPARRMLELTGNHTLLDDDRELLGDDDDTEVDDNR